MNFAAVASQPINDLALDVTVTSPAPRGDSSAIDKYVGSPSPLHLGTVATLQEANGQTFRLIDDVRSGPSISKASDGSYTFVFHYTPEYGGALRSHHVSELGTVYYVGTRLGGVLGALGLPPDSTQVTHLALSVNGQSAVAGTLQVPVRLSGKKFQLVDVRAVFAPIAASG